MIASVSRLLIRDRTNPSVSPPQNGEKSDRCHLLETKSLATVESVGDEGAAVCMR